MTPARQEPAPDRAAEAARRQLAALQRALAERLEPEPTAWSADGRGFVFRASLAAPLPVGGYVLLRPAGGAELLGQVTAAGIVEREGPEVAIAGDGGLGIGGGLLPVTGTTHRLKVSQLEGAGRLLGARDADGLRGVGPGDTVDAAPMGPADPAVVAAYLDGWARGRPTVDVGEVPGGGRALLGVGGFSRHTFLCGQSGSGKTYALGVLLERLLLESDFRLVVLDPNGDYARLGELRDPGTLRRELGPAHTPEADRALRERWAAVGPRVVSLRAAGPGVPETAATRLRFDRLPPETQGLVLRLDPVADREEYAELRRLEAGFGGAPHTLADIRDAAAATLAETARRVALRIDNLRVADWPLWAGNDDPGLAGRLDGDPRALVLDIGSHETGAEAALVAERVLGELWERREARRRTLIVIDEAHNVCPAEPAGDVQRAAMEQVVRIAGEGRKFGLHLLLATQRPQKLHPGALTQCDNLLLMRTGALTDLEELRRVFSFVPGAMVERAAGFALGECLVGGPVVPTPLIARIGGRLTPEGGGDVPAAPARP